MDNHQQRYLEHQNRKRQEINGGKSAPIIYYSEDEKNALFSIIANRRSRRTFGGTVSPKDLMTIIRAGNAAPSSCNRGGVIIRTVVGNDIKYLSDLLVGGVGWVENADVVLLLLADMVAYKAPGEDKYMPYLDAGFMAQNIYLAAEALGISACFINPNIRPENREKFYDKFVEDGFMLCGAMALG